MYSQPNKYIHEATAKTHNHFCGAAQWKNDSSHLYTVESTFPA